MDNHSVTTWGQDHEVYFNRDTRANDAWESRVELYKARHLQVGMRVYVHLLSFVLWKRPENAVPHTCGPTRLKNKTFTSIGRLSLRPHHSGVAGSPHPSALTQLPSLIPWGFRFPQVSLYFLYFYYLCIEMIIALFCLVLSLNDTLYSLLYNSIFIQAYICKIYPY